MDPIIPQPQEQSYSSVSESKHFLNKKFIGTFVILLLLGTGAYFSIWWWGNQQQSNIYTFEECAKAKDSKILETYPEQCMTKDGQKFFNPNQQIDSTSDWKTYTNTQYGFEFRYLKDWEILDAGLGQIFYAPSLKDSLDEIGYCDRSSECNQEYFSLSTVLDGQPSPPVDKKTFNGVEFIVYRVYYDTTEELKTVYEYEIPNKGVMLTFAALQEGLPYLDQILSTFKFTK